MANGECAAHRTPRRAALRDAPKRVTRTFRTATTRRAAPSQNYRLSDSTSTKYLADSVSKRTNTIFLFRFHSYAIGRSPVCHSAFFLRTRFENQLTGCAPRYNAFQPRCSPATNPRYIHIFSLFLHKERFYGICRGVFQ